MISEVFNFFYTFSKFHLYDHLPLRWGYFFVIPGVFFSRKNRSRAEELRLFLETMGPVYIKFGQLLSTRTDLFPKDYIDQLALLQDKVPPFSGQEALRICEEALGSGFGKIQDFSMEPLGSASVAQVHAAVLNNKESIILKIRRPGIVERFKKDIIFLRKIASWASFFIQDPRYKFQKIVDEFESVVLNETNFLIEAGNALQLKRNFIGSKELYVPHIYIDYCRPEILVMERIYDPGVKEIIHDKIPGLNYKKLALNGVNIFLKQVFEDGFFHADMHPGNLFIHIDSLDEPQYRAVDFGIVGVLEQKDLDYLAMNLLAFLKRDYRQIVLLHVEAGWVKSTVSQKDFEFALRAVCEPVFEKPLKEISFGQTLFMLFQIAYKFDMVVQPQLLLLQKTLVAVEALGRQLYPDLNLWETAHPFLEKWIRERYSVKRQASKIFEKLPFMLDKLNDRICLTQDRVHHQPKILFIQNSTEIICISFLGHLVYGISHPYNAALFFLVLIAHFIFMLRMKKFSSPESYFKEYN